MTREQAKQILGENATEEQVTNLLNQLHTSEKSKNDEIANLTAKLSDYDAMKSQLDEINKQKEQERVAKLTEEQKIEEMKKQIEANLKESQITKNKAKVMTTLAGLDIDEELIDSIVSEDEALSLEKANKLVSKINSVKEEVARQTKENLATGDILPNMNNANPNANVMTWEKYMSMSSEEQDKFQLEHTEEFNKL